MVKHWMLAEMIAVCKQWCSWILRVPCYHGPHIGHQFCVMGFSLLFIMHWAHGIENTNTPRLMDIITYLPLPLKRLCKKGTLLKRNSIDRDLVERDSEIIETTIRPG